MTPVLRRALPRLLLLALAAAVAALAGLSLGSTDLGWTGALTGLIAPEGTPEALIVRGVRAPRVAAAFVVGGLLGMAGALMQVLVRNPLADPYVMGSAGGASAAFLIAMLAGVDPALFTPAAFAGALASMLVVAMLARIGNHTDSTRMLLTGVMLAAGWGAVVTLLLTLAPAARVPGLLFWLLGDLDNAAGWLPAFVVLALAGVAGALLGRPLNLIAHGESAATALGVPVARVQLAVCVLASLLTAAAVSLAGPVGFVGLVAPHLVRLGISADHRLLLPGSLLAGGGLLVLADVLARTVATPTQLPVGVITALVGVPLFLALLVHERNTAKGTRHGG